MEKEITYTKEAIEYIAKLAQGGMRDAITMLDKCLSYSNDLSIENVTKALGIANYDYLKRMVISFFDPKADGDGLNVINEVYMSGYDLKQFIKALIDFALDIIKYALLGNFSAINCPDTQDMRLFFSNTDFDQFDCRHFLSSLIKLSADIKWDTNPKSRIEAWYVTRGK